MRPGIEEVKQSAKITDTTIAGVAGHDVMTKGAAQLEMASERAKGIDRDVPFASGASIALATKDVYKYLRNIGVRDQIETGVRQAMKPDAPTVVVGHSLGTVVSYSLLRCEGEANRWVAPLYVTVGAPLAITAIDKGLAPNKHPKCVGEWFNAMDERDVVALYSLDSAHFPITPWIENKTDVQNQTENRHGISGYLNDEELAKRIYDTLVE